MAIENESNQTVPFFNLSDLLLWNQGWKVELDSILLISEEGNKKRKKMSSFLLFSLGAVRNESFMKPNFNFYLFHMLFCFILVHHFLSENGQLKPNKWTKMSTPKILLILSVLFLTIIIYHLSSRHQLNEEEEFVCVDTGRIHGRRSMREMLKYLMQITSVTSLSRISMW